MPPLPRPDDALVKNLAENPKRAYLLHILPSEDTAVKANHDHLHIRVLGALLIHAPTPHASETVAQEIMLANSHYGKLDDLGKLPSFEAQRSGIQHELVQTPHNHSGAKRNALIRDGFRCMLSGEIEVNVWKVNPSAFPPVDIVSAGPTSCCHILPEWTNDISSFDNADDKRPAWQAEGKRSMGSSGPFLRIQYTDEDARTGVEGPAAAHRLSNILTLSAKWRTQFEGLEELWLEAIPGQEQVPFRVGDVDIPGFPHPALGPRFLELHAACCKVAQMSGAAE
ncbi:hypothetical protein TRAPUB_7259 [Trametes pubescens]|uniref:HNH nuclease domain-containing protein n=1 Tax=Trametes pubescens TaxID=154538 RepID=A0A1M2V3Q9_TRAPU|nr:hypothetical protein TRAPUB_7259 [Trametes pubescens]